MSVPKGDLTQKPPVESTAPRVFFLANDAVFDQTLAFLESFREHNASLRLSMIPFAADIERLNSISSLYDFEICDDDLAKWDQLATLLFPVSPQKYRNRVRKLQVFASRSPVTVYIDTDTIINREFSFLGPLLLSSSYDVLCTGTRNDPWVYNENYTRYSQTKNSKRFSDGFFAFRSDKITAESAHSAIVDNIDMYLDIRAKDVYSQPITNFIIDILGLRVGEVFTACNYISPQIWYADHKLSLIDSKIVSSDGKEVLFLHWAGPVDLTSEYRFKSVYTEYMNRAKSHLRLANIPGYQ